MIEVEIPRMGILQRIFGRRVIAVQSPGYETALLWKMSTAGIRVSVEEVLKVPAVLACVRAISETVGMLPLKLKFAAAGTTKDAGWDSRSTLVNDDPNDYQTGDQFRQAMTAAYLLTGDAFAEKEPNLARTGVYALHFVNPERVTNVFIDQNGILRYVVDGKELTRETIFHIPGPIFNGSSFRGESLVGRAGEALGLAVAQQDYASGYYGNGATPATAVITPKGFKEDARARLKESFKNDFRGAKNKHKFALLEDGVDIKSVGSNAHDAMLIEARKEQVIEICRVFRMPPHLVQSLDKATFSNIEEQAREFIEYTMMPHFVKWEKNLGKQLLTKYERQAYYWKFSVDALLRGKTLERYQAYQLAIMNGILSPNEARGLEDWNPYPEGDIYLKPSNTQRIDEPSKGGTNGQ
jgi:HK97 family phage portal protein